MGYPDGWNNLAYVNNGVTMNIDNWGCSIVRTEKVWFIEPGYPQYGEWGPWKYAAQTYLMPGYWYRTREVTYRYRAYNVECTYEITEDDEFWNKVSDWETLGFAVVGGLVSLINPPAGVSVAISGGGAITLLNPGGKTLVSMGKQTPTDEYKNDKKIESQRE